MSQLHTSCSSVPPVLPISQIIVIVFRVLYSVIYNNSKLMYLDSPKGWSGTSKNFEELYITDTPWERLWQWFCHIMVNQNWCTPLCKCTSQPFCQVICFPTKTDTFSCQNQFWQEILAVSLVDKGHAICFPTKNHHFGRRTEQITWQNGCDVHLHRGVHQFWCIILYDVTHGHVK